MTKLLSYLGQVKLSIQQYTLIILSGAVGILVLMLKLQGSKIHSLQIQLLTQQFKTIDDSDDAAIASAKARLQSAKEAFLKASKTLLIALISASLLFGGPRVQAKPQESPIKACKALMAACDETIALEDKEINDLKSQLKTIAAQKDPSHIPAWVYLTLGAAVGILTVKVLK